jgi:hypothetical protein
MNWNAKFKVQNVWKEIRHFTFFILNFALRGDAALAFARKSLATWAISSDQCIVTAFSGGR